MCQTRKRLPDRRPAVSFRLRHAGMEYAVSVGYFEDGQVGEIFLNAGKVNSTVDIASRDAAIAASLALQHGASPKVLAGAMSREPDGSPSGPLGAVLQLIMHHKI